MSFSTFQTINRFIPARFQLPTLNIPSTGQLNFGYGTTNNCYCVSGASKFQISSGTFECWIKCPVNTGGSADLGWRGLVGIYNAVSFVIYNGKLGTYIFGLDVILTGGKAVNDNNWHHCVFTFQNGGNCYIYLDGGQVGSSAFAIGSLGSPLRIGTGSVDLQRCMCDIKNVCIYNTVLSPATIWSNYTLNHGTMPAVNASGIIGRFSLKDGSGSIATNTASGSTDGNLNIYKTTSTNNTAGAQVGTQSTTSITNSYWYV